MECFQPPFYLGNPEFIDKKKFDEIPFKVSHRICERSYRKLEIVIFFIHELGSVLIINKIFPRIFSIIFIELTNVEYV